jgi:hypothetical protein
MFMTLTRELPPELESRVNDEAARRGLAPADYVLELVRTATPEEPERGDDELRKEVEELLAGVWTEEEPRPTTGAELVAYWERHGLIGTRPDIKDSVEYVQEMRRKAERRDWS